MDIANIHSMRESIQAVRTLVESPSSPEADLSWLSRVESTKWLYHVRLVLSAAILSAHAVNKRQTVLVHCSDGWDRTGQVCALVQMLLDPHYRTLSGFMQVIEKVCVASLAPLTGA
jgi:protein tyrosine phosphatase